MEAAQDGAGALLAYATLLAVVAATVTAEARGDPDEQDIIDACARAWLHASALLLLCAAGLRGYLPGVKKSKPQPYLARILLLCVGLGFFWRAAHFYLTPEYHRHNSTEVAKLAVGTMAFLGTLAIAISIISFFAASRVSSLLQQVNATPRERFLTRHRLRRHATSSTAAPLLGNTEKKVN